MRTRDELIDFADGLIAEGNAVLATRFEKQTSSFTKTSFVDLQSFHKWKTSAIHLVEMLGPFGEAWRGILNAEKSERNYLVTALTIQGAVESIRENLEKGRLARVEDLVAAETFANLLEQAQYLLENNYFLASGVLCRAVLEERLRMLCDRESCLPTKSRPTINDYAQSLYGLGGPHSLGAE